MGRYVVGIDEAGRGAWAGPLIAAAVMLPEGLKLEGVKDSKQLTAKKRQELCLLINRAAISVGVGWVDPQDVDSIGLQASTSQAMGQALSQIPSSQDSSKVIIDGHINYLEGVANTEAIIKADISIPSVAAASIVAKHYRDSYMMQLAKLYPDYGFEDHVGYGTKRHRESLINSGVCPVHRLSYRPIKQVLSLE